jgi:endogenous inhibitor of DNA gyrase (YacG/DUF329 family)
VRRGRPRSGPREAASKRPRCPICNNPADEKYRPFCSATCADIDLGRWLGGRYADPGEPIAAVPEDDDESSVN